MRVKVLFTILFSLSLGFSQQTLQYYPIGKIILNNRTTIEGKELKITAENVSLSVNGNKNTFELTDVYQVLAKAGKAKQNGNICAGSCASIALLSILMTGTETTSTDEYGNEITVKIDMGQYLLGTAIWSGISYGIGYLTGMLMDDWKIVYFKS